MENNNILNVLTQTDISNLNLICSKSPLPIVQYLLENPKDAEIKKTNVFLANHNVQDIDSQCKSLSKLHELDLIKITYNDWYEDIKIYSDFSDYENNNPEFKEYFRKRGLVFPTDVAQNLIKNI